MCLNTPSHNYWKSTIFKNTTYCNATTDGVSTRSADNGVTLFEPRYMTNTGSRAFKFAAPRLYNDLPVEMRKLSNMENFKAKLKTFLFSKCYDLDDQTVNENYKV